MSGESFQVLFNDLFCGTNKIKCFILSKKRTAEAKKEWSQFCPNYIEI